MSRRRIAELVALPLLLGGAWLLLVRGLAQDRVQGIGPITSANLAAIRSIDGRRWLRQLPVADLAGLDAELRAHREPVAGGGLSAPTARLVVEDGGGRRATFVASSVELHPRGPLPACLVDPLRALERGETGGWRPAD